MQTSLGAPAGEPTAVWKYSKVSKRIQKHVKANGCFKYLINFLLNSIAVYKRFQKNHHTFVHLPSFFSNSILNLSQLLYKESFQFIMGGIKKQISYGQAGRKGWPPPPFMIFFGCVQKERRFWSKNTLLSPFEGAKFSHLLTVRAKVADLPPLMVSLNAFFTTSLSMFIDCTSHPRAVSNIRPLWFIKFY